MVADAFRERGWKVSEEPRSGEGRPDFLASAHGKRDPEPIWMAIDRKARKPAINGLQLRFVRFSGQALMQGVVNMRIGREPIRVYSVAKTVADCLTYRRKVGVNLAVEALREGILQGK